MRSQRTAESFSAQLSDKLRQPQSSPNDIGGLRANISHSLRAAAEAVVGFERPPKRNQWHDEECCVPSAGKNDAYKRTLQSAATRAIVDDYRQKRSEENRLIRQRRGSRKGVRVRKSRCTGIGTMLRNFSKTQTSDGRFEARSVILQGRKS